MVMISCTTKGCLAHTEAKLNKETQEVLCDQCGNQIAVTDQMKRTLDSLGQVVRTKSIKAFQQYCPNCKVHRSLYVEGNAAFCEICATQITVTAAFLQGLKLHVERMKKYNDEGIE